MRQRFRRTILVMVLALGLVLGGWTGTGQVDTPAQAASPVVTLYGSAPDAPDSQLQSIVEDVVGDLPGTWGVVVKKLDTGQYAVYNGDVPQVSASLYKMWVLAELYHQASLGEVSLDDYATVTYDDAYFDSLTD